MESNSAIKKKGLLISKTWMDLRAIMLSEVNAASRKRTRTVGFTSVTLFKARPQQNDGEQNHCAQGLQVGEGV